LSYQLACFSPRGFLPYRSPQRRVLAAVVPWSMRECVLPTGLRNFISFSKYAEELRIFVLKRKIDYF
jgi:hypothetical protein